MNYTQSEIWLIISLMAIGTFAIRFSFLGLIGTRRIPSLIERMLRFTPVAVLPGMIAPLVLWPSDAINGVTMLHIATAIITFSTAYATKKVTWGIAIGIALFFGPNLVELL